MANDYENEIALNQYDLQYTMIEMEKLLDELQHRYDQMPFEEQNDDPGNHLETAISSLEDAIEDIEDAIERLGSALESLNDLEEIQKEVES